MLIIGLIPFFVNLCRLCAAVYQIFVYRKYSTGCLKYYVNENNWNQTIISQPGLRRCWSWVEYPFFLLNWLGLLIHTSLLIGIGIGKLTETSIHKEMIEVEDSDQSSVGSYERILRYECENYSTYGSENGSENGI